MAELALFGSLLCSLVSGLAVVAGLMAYIRWEDRRREERRRELRAGKLRVPPPGGAGA